MPTMETSPSPRRRLDWSRATPKLEALLLNPKVSRETMAMARSAMRLHNNIEARRQAKK